MQKAGSMGKEGGNLIGFVLWRLWAEAVNKVSSVGSIVREEGDGCGSRFV